MKRTVIGIALYPNYGSYLAEMEGFEPPHALRRLADFESAPFSHLGTSPKTRLLYQPKPGKSRLIRGNLYSFCQFQNSIHSGHNPIISTGTMRNQTATAIFDSGRSIAESTATLVTKGIQRAIAEPAVKAVRIATGMTGEIRTGFVLIEFITFHRNLPEWTFHSSASVL